MLTGTLLSFSLPIPAAAFSRSYPIVIASAKVSQGCDIRVLATNDTIEVCSCHTQYAVRMEPASVVTSGDELLVPLYADLRGVPAASMELYGSLRYDATTMAFTGFSTDESVFVGTVLDAVEPERGRIEFHGVQPKAVATDTVPICTARFNTVMARKAVSTIIELEQARIYARCCPTGEAVAQSLVFVDGLCERLLVRKQALGQSYPNPSVNTVWIPFHLTMKGSITLVIYDTYGRLVRTVYCGELAEGPHEIPTDVSALMPGVYYTALSMEGTTVTRPVLVRGRGAGE
jgi:hypothetical protein